MWIIFAFIGLLLGGYFLGQHLIKKSKIPNYSIKNWIKIDDKNPLPDGEEVLAFNKEWIDEDFCPTGVRIGFYTDGDDGKTFYSAKWNNDQDSYSTHYEEGDDYDTWQSIGKNKVRKYYHKNGERFEGYLPNMPTHFMYINSPE